MQRREPFGQLRAENRERRHTAKCGEMAGSGIVADENTSAVNRLNQFRDGGRCHDIGFS